MQRVNAIVQLNLHRRLEQRLSDCPAGYVRVIRLECQIKDYSTLTSLNEPYAISRSKRFCRSLSVE